MTSARKQARLEANRVRARINELEERLLAIPVGVKSTTVDGTTTSWSRDAVHKEISHLRRRLAVLEGRRERVASIRLNNAF